MCKEDSVDERAAIACSYGSVEWDEHGRGEERGRQRGEMKEERERDEE